MSLRISRNLVRIISLIIRLLGVCLESIRKVLDIIDNGISDGSVTLPSWYFELVDILSVLQETCDKVERISVSDEIKNVQE